MGSLKVIVNGVERWTAAGNKGSSWKDGLVDLAAYAGKQPVIEFVGTRGSSYTGDIAIDAVKFVSGSPTKPPTAAPTMAPTMAPNPGTASPTIAPSPTPPSVIVGPPGLAGPPGPPGKTISSVGPPGPPGP